MKKRILILYTSVGLGHKSIAENIGWQLEQRGFSVRLEDVLKVQSGVLVNVSRKLHGCVNRYLPFVWSFFYHATNSWLASFALPLREWIASKNCQETLSVLNDFSPDVIIATQSSASAIVSHLKRRALYKGLFGIAFSDFHLHKFWIYDNADFYLANIIEQREEMVKLGLPKEKVILGGITLQPHLVVNRKLVKRKLGIREGEKVVLFGSGSQGIGFNEKVLREVCGLPGVRPLVVCGNNNKLLHGLSHRFSNNSAIVVGYYTPMDELYSIADMFITKPGGLTIAEALRWQLPILVTYMLPGQEELNLRYLQKRKLVIMDNKHTLETVKEELLTGKFKTQLGENSALNEIIHAPGIDQLEQMLHSS